jgi:hypothetical protein
MEHRACAGADHPTHRRAIGDVAGHQPQPSVLGQGQGCGCIVEQHELLDIAPLEQVPRHAGPQKAAAAGDDDAHGSAPDAGPRRSAGPAGRAAADPGMGRLAP